MSTLLQWRILTALPVILLVSFFASIIAYVITSNVETSYTVHFSYLVSLRERKDVDEYQFDGYYALQATEMFADTLAQWLQAPEVVVDAFREAGLLVPASDIILRTVLAEKTAPQFVRVSVMHTSRDDALMIARGLQDVMRQNVERYHDNGISELQFQAVVTDQWVSERRISVFVVTIAAFVFVFFVAVNVVLLFKEL